MGWKGTIRSFGSAMRAAERDAKRRQRELERQEKQFEKMQELEQAAYEVEVFENHIEIIQSLHKECSDAVDWESIAKTPAPEEPQKVTKREKSARAKAENYKPGFIDKLLKREGKKQQKLSDAVPKSQEKDKKEYEKKVKKWELEFADWNESTKLSKLLVEGDAKSKMDVIKELNPFSEISNLGSSLAFSVDESSIVEVEIYIHADDIVPTEVKSLLRSGRLSTKQMPKGRFNELYQDYVCSCTLRIANELFSILPDKMAVVTCVDQLLNSKTGHLEKMPILSAAISRKTLLSLNMNRIDPSDSMDNFIHHMSFRKAQGFQPVSRIDREGLGSE